MNYNENIRALREDAGYTQAHIASILNTEQSYYSKYEISSGEECRNSWDFCI